MISLLHALSSYFRDTTLEGAAGLIISALRLRLRAGAGAENYLEIIHYRRPPPQQAKTGLAGDP